MRQSALLLAIASIGTAAVVERRQDSSSSSSSSSSSVSSVSSVSSGSSSSSSVPQYFQTTPELYAGPTPTGSAPFLAETNPAPFPSVSYIPNSPLETQVPITGNTNNSNIFQLFGQLSHYFPNPTGFGVDEYPLPSGSNITWLNMLSRHGSRYPTTGSGAPTFGQKIANATGKFNATGALSFLNTWKYSLGAEILVPVGRQELYDSGVLHQYMYGHLYPNNGTKIVARSTTEDRMTKSAENFLAGFFGLEWPQNATLELIIEQNNFNNSLAGYDNCPNSNKAQSSQGNNATTQWSQIYLKNALSRLSPLVTGLNLTIADLYNMQSLCAYETVGLGYSEFCGLFSYDEWEGYEYSVDINFAGDDSFQSPTGRAVGIGYVQEVLARMNHQYVNTTGTQANLTLDSMNTTFPLYQALNLDFSHDTNIMSILTAFGFTQFATFLPATAIQPNRDLIVSHMEPFAARLDIELIQAPSPVNSNRSSSNVYQSGNATTYVHFILNQRTLPLYKSFKQCETRDDGWCELGSFMQAQSDSLSQANFEFACFGNYSTVPYGNITNGAPLTSS